MNHSNLGKWLRHYRQAANLSVKEVIEKFEREYDITYTNKAVYGWENGQNQPSADTFLILCRMYNITNIVESMGYLSTKDHVPLVLSDKEKELIMKYRSNQQLQPAIHKLLDMEE